MPRVETYYFCDVCNKKWGTKTEAEKCEKTHFIPESVDGARYEGEDYKRKYPDSVVVHLKNEKGELTSVRYYRKSENN